MSTTAIICMCASIWITIGAVVCLCAMEFLDARPSMAKTFAVLILWPKAINKSAWLQIVPKSN
jgi:hypothetical protein